MLSRQSRLELDALHVLISTATDAERESSMVMTETVETMIIICRRERVPIADDVHAWAVAKPWPGFRGTERSCLRLTECSEVVHHTLRLTGLLTTRERTTASRLPKITAA